MNRNEAIDILETIKEVYPRYEITKRKATILIPGLLKMDYDGVLKNLETFAAEKPYPPTIAEIASYPKEANSHFEQRKQWEQEAQQVPDHKKQEFQDRLRHLSNQWGNRE